MPVGTRSALQLSRQHFDDELRAYYAEHFRCLDATQFSDKIKSLTARRGQSHPLDLYRLYHSVCGPGLCKVADLQACGKRRPDRISALDLRLGQGTLYKSHAPKRDLYADFRKIFGYVNERIEPFVFSKHREFMFEADDVADDLGEGGEAEGAVVVDDDDEEEDDDDDDVSGVVAAHLRDVQGPDSSAAVITFSHNLRNELQSFLLDEQQTQTSNSDKDSVNARDDINDLDSIVVVVDSSDDDDSDDGNGSIGNLIAPGLVDKDNIVDPTLAAFVRPAVEQLDYILQSGSGTTDDDDDDAVVSPALTKSALLANNGVGKSFFANELMRSSELLPYEYASLNTHNRRLEALQLIGHNNDDEHDPCELPETSVFDPQNGLLRPNTPLYGKLEYEQSVVDGIKGHAQGETDARKSAGNALGTGAYILPSKDSTNSTTNCLTALRYSSLFHALIETVSLDEIKTRVQETDWVLAQDNNAQKDEVLYASACLLIKMLRRIKNPPEPSSIPVPSHTATRTDTSPVDLTRHVTASTTTTTTTTTTSNVPAAASASFSDAFPEFDDEMDLDLDSDSASGMDVPGSSFHPPPPVIDIPLKDEFLCNPEAFIDEKWRPLLGRPRVILTPGKDIVHDRVYLRDTLNTLLSSPDSLLIRRIVVFVPSTILRQLNTEIVDAPGCDETDPQKVSMLAQVLDESDHIIVFLSKTLSASREVLHKLTNHVLQKRLVDNPTGHKIPAVSIVLSKERTSPLTFNGNNACIKKERQGFRKSCTVTLAEALHSVCCEDDAHTASHQSYIQKGIRYSHIFPLFFSSCVANYEYFLCRNSQDYMARMRFSGMYELLGHLFSAQSSEVQLMKRVNDFVKGQQDHLDELMRNADKCVESVVGKDKVQVATEVKQRSASLLSSRKSRKSSRSSLTTRHVSDSNSSSTNGDDSTQQSDGGDGCADQWALMYQWALDRLQKETAQLESLLADFKTACGDWTEKTLQSITDDDAPALLVQLSSYARQKISEVFSVDANTRYDGVSHLSHLLFKIDRLPANTPCFLQLSALQSALSEFESGLLTTIVAFVDKGLVKEIVAANAHTMEYGDDETADVARMMISMFTHNSEEAVYSGRKAAIAKMRENLSAQHAASVFKAKKIKELLHEAIGRALSCGSVRTHGRQLLAQAKQHPPNSLTPEHVQEMALIVLRDAVANQLPDLVRDSIVRIYAKQKIALQDAVTYPNRPKRALAYHLRNERVRVLSSLAQSSSNSAFQKGVLIQAFNTLQDTLKNAAANAGELQKQFIALRRNQVDGMLREMSDRSQLRFMWNAAKDPRRDDKLDVNLEAFLGESSLMRAPLDRRMPSLVPVDQYVSCDSNLWIFMLENLVNCWSGKADDAGERVDNDELALPNYLTHFYVNFHVDNAAMRSLLELCVGLVHLMPAFRSMWGKGGRFENEEFAQRRFADLFVQLLATSALTDSRSLSFLSQSAELKEILQSKSVSALMINVICGKDADLVKLGKQSIALMGLFILSLVVDRFGEPFDLMMSSAGGPAVRILPDPQIAPADLQSEPRGHKVVFCRGHWYVTVAHHRKEVKEKVQTIGSIEASVPCAREDQRRERMMEKATRERLVPANAQVSCHAQSAHAHSTRERTTVREQAVRARAPTQPPRAPKRTAPPMEAMLNFDEDLDEGRSKRSKRSRKR